MSKYISVKIPLWIRIQVEDVETVPTEELAKKVNKKLQELAGSNDGSELLANMNVNARDIISIKFEK